MSAKTRTKKCAAAPLGSCSVVEKRRRIRVAGPFVYGLSVPTDDRTFRPEVSGWSVPTRARRGRGANPTRERNSNQGKREVDSKQNEPRRGQSPRLRRDVLVDAPGASRESRGTGGKGGGGGRAGRQGTVGPTRG